ncbi:LOW QUALITY PROTEIN: deoxynucleoside triphosphate triphosphohydrolase SAMHD1-like [Diadema setosum]|uniref:LOW QUALITY PROTEIN: deoxynucleoside triphosphate triphosphohydrolase SAMHD1-like n=1 Tax=Diadema setosum TaxID=31175 RepID=UPI003B3A5836
MLKSRNIASAGKTANSSHPSKTGTHDASKKPQKFTHTTLLRRILDSISPTSGFLSSTNHRTPATTNHSLHSTFPPLLLPRVSLPPIPHNSDSRANCAAHLILHPLLVPEDALTDARHPPHLIRTPLFGSDLPTAKLFFSLPSNDPDKHYVLMVINDPVYGNIQLPRYCRMIIDTPEFQRLRFIKQLGPVSYVYPCAVHTRFEHCLGACFLARKLISSLQVHENIEIEKTEIRCVVIAALCHDLGHGPFSHLFAEVIPQQKNEEPWKHEEQSVRMFLHLISKNGLERELEVDFCITQNHIEFICELIRGRSTHRDQRLTRENKFYLYQIVNNTVNGIDVDKWDYLARDALFLAINSSFDFQRILPFVKVCEVKQKDGSVRKELCYRDKVAADLNHMFLTRRRLHYSAYQHRVTTAVAIMYKDAFKKAGRYITFETADGKEYNLLESVEDPEAFSQVTDGIVHEIVRSKSRDRGMVEARKIIRRIHERKLYQCIIELPHAQREYKIDPKKIKKEIEEDDDDISPDERIWRSRNLVVEVSSFTYGMQTKNPFEHIPFYKKSHTDRDKAACLPEDKWPVDVPSGDDKIEDITIRIYSRELVTDDELQRARTDFENNRAKKIKRERPAPSTPKKQYMVQPLRSLEPEAGITPAVRRHFSHPSDQSSLN